VLSASDMVYSISSLLESPEPVYIERILNKEESKEESDQEEELVSSDAFMVNNFWCAYDALSNDTLSK
jgi:hypothetical protein